MIATAFFGSYACIRGISLYAGGFPNERSIHKIIAEGHITKDDFSKTFYIYIGAIILLFIISLIFQWCLYPCLKNKRTKRKEQLARDSLIENHEK